jgi:hypothetical protein
MLKPITALETDELIKNNYDNILRRIKCNMKETVGINGTHYECQVKYQFDNLNYWSKLPKFNYGYNQRNLIAVHMLVNGSTRS